MISHVAVEIFFSLRVECNMDDGLVKNTLAFQFPQGAPAPSLVEMARFVKNLDADLDSMETSYKLSEEKCVCVKFKSLQAMKEAQTQIPEICVFRYSNGEKVEVKMAIAGCCTKYVRIFDLPPEVPDSEISAVLGRYGIVKRTVREKFPADLGLNLFTGVRGVYLDIKKVVPASLYFLNRKGRIFYEGLKQRCYMCKEEGHLKVDCPQKSGVKSSINAIPVERSNVTGGPKNNGPNTTAADDGEETILQTQQSLVAEQPSYSFVLSGKHQEKDDTMSVPKMTTLVSSRNKSATTDSDHSIDLMESEADSKDKHAVKRQHSTEESVDTDDELLPDFTKVVGNRRSTRSGVKKVMTPLETISKESLQSGNRRSSSK